MNTVWRIAGGSVLDFAAPVSRPGGGTMYASLGTGSICLEREKEGKSYLTMRYVGNDLMDADGIPVEGHGVCVFSDLEGNAIYGTMRLDTDGINNEKVNSVLLTIESGSGKFAGFSGQIALASHISPSDSDSRYIGFLEGEGSVQLR